jgi:peroxiredoxin
MRSAMYYHGLDTLIVEAHATDCAKEVIMLKVGDSAPDFSVLDHTGVRHTLADYRGKHLVLWFFPKADTPG